MKNKSFTLIEVVIAVFVITVGTSGAFSLIQKTLAFTSINSSRLVAAYLGQEGIELVRSIRDGNYLAKITWDSGLSACAGGCEIDYNDSALAPYSGRFLKIDGGLYNYDSGTDTFFKREIIITPQADVMNVSVRVSWTERGRTHELPVQTELHDWR